MKLCITAAGNDVAATTDSTFGRAPWFVLINTETGAHEALANSSLNAGHGAGIAAAQLMADHSVDAVLTGKLGPKAQAALAAADIAMHEGLANCTVAQALEQFRAGKYGNAPQGSATSAASESAPLKAAMQAAGQGQGGGRGAWRFGDRREL